MKDTKDKIKNTTRNKIRRIEKELKKNPNNTIAKQSLEKWKTRQ